MESKALWRGKRYVVFAMYLTIASQKGQLAVTRKYHFREEFLNDKNLKMNKLSLKLWVQGSFS